MVSLMKAAKNLLKMVSKEVSSRRIFIDYNRDCNSSILLAGNGRGGTTWVSEIVNYNNEYRYIFEPFHPIKGICHGFKDRQYLRPDNQNENFIKPVRDIFCGKVRGRNWMDRHNRKFISHQRLVKEVRANLLLKWVHTQFPDIPIILLMRHPCAVANSQVKKNMGINFEEIFAQQDLLEDFLNPFKKEIDRAQNDFEKHIFLWCIENYVPLKQFEEGEIHLAFYENFCLKPEQEISRLFSFLDKGYHQSIFKALEKPSATGSASDLPPDKRDLNVRVNGWRKSVTSQQFERAMEILALFGLDNIYTEDALPNVVHAHEIMGKRESVRSRAASA